MAKTTHSLDEVDVLKELEFRNIQYVTKGEEEVNLNCPFHEDDSPSLGLNTDKRIFHCRAAQCKATGNFVYYLAKVEGISVDEVWKQLANRWNVQKLPSISQETVEQYHQNLFTLKTPVANQLRAALAKRGITEDICRKFKIGIHSYRDRITIPVFVGARVVNVRYYQPNEVGKPTDVKFYNHYKKGINRVYNERDLDQEAIWICGGELKAAVVSHLLRPYGIGAICGTSGEGNWNPVFNRELVGKRVFICMDVDKAGQVAAEQVANTLRKDNVFIIRLPLDLEKHPKGDVSDYVGEEGATAKDLMALMEGAERVEWDPDEITSMGGPATEVALGAIERDSEMIGKALSFQGVMAVSDTERYYFPKKIEVTCSRSHDFCLTCGVQQLPLSDQTNITEVTCSPCDPHMMSWKDSPDRLRDVLLRDICRIPSDCNKASIELKEKQFGHSAVLSPIINPADENPVYDSKQALIVGVDVEPNVEYEFKGTVQSDPGTQKVRVMISEAEEINTFHGNLTAEDLEALEIFRPSEWTEDALSAKMKEIYDDISANVSYIYGRPEIHFAFDMTQFSPVWMQYRNRQVKGWVNSIVMGDSGQGKSEVPLAMLDYYGVGGRIDCKSATFAGLVGGLVKHGTDWMVAWGALPRYDRSLAIFEECHGLPVEIIGKMTDVRSRGIATVEKIHKRSALARTRLMMIANCRWEKQVGNFLCGVEAIRELVGAPEDIRRVDIAVVVSKDDITRDAIEEGETRKVEHRFTRELSRNLLRVAWNTNEHDIHFSADVLKLIRRLGSEMLKDYECDILLVDNTTIEHKIARLACALAARTYSYEDGMLMVRECHVQFVTRMLRKLYSGSAMRYDVYAKNSRARRTIVDGLAVAGAIKSLPNAKTFVDNILIHEEFQDSSVMDWSGHDRDDYASFRSVLVSNRCLEPAQNPRFYVKTPGFIQLLKTLSTENLNENPF